MKKFYFIVIALLFCFWFSEVVVNATPPINTLIVDAEFEYKQKLDDIKLTMYFYDVPRDNLDKETFYLIRICDNTLTSHCEETCYSVHNLINTISFDDVYYCKNGCVIDKIGPSEYNENFDDYNILNKKFIYKQEYTLPTNLFKYDKGELNVDNTFMDISIVSEQVWSSEGSNIVFDYKIEGDYIYLTRKSSATNSSVMNCK